jgi:hypothetical protein
MLWGQPIAYWDLWGLRAMFLGAGLGFTALVVSLASSYILYRVADVAQAKLTTTVAEAEVKIVKARQEAAETTLAFEMYKSPRQLNGSQQSQIAKAASAFPDTPYNFSISMEKESIDLMEQIAFALNAGKWRRVATKAEVVHRPPTGAPEVALSLGKGIMIQVADERRNDLGPAAKAILDVLKLAGLEADGHIMPPKREMADAVHIYIGSKN